MAGFECTTATHASRVQTTLAACTHVCSVCPYMQKCSSSIAAERHAHALHTTKTREASIDIKASMDPAALCKAHHMRMQHLGLPVQLGRSHSVASVLCGFTLGVGIHPNSATQVNAFASFKRPNQWHTVPQASCLLSSLFDPLALAHTPKTQQKATPASSKTAHSIPNVWQLISFLDLSHSRSELLHARYYWLRPAH